MIRETLERGGIFFAGAAALIVFLAICIEPLRGDVARVSALVVSVYATAFFLAMLCDRRIHRVLTASQFQMPGSNGGAGRSATWFGAGDSTTLVILHVVLFAEILLAVFIVGVYTATTLAAVSGFAIVTALSTCEYVRRKQREV